MANPGGKTSGISGADGAKDDDIGGFDTEVEGAVGTGALIADDALIVFVSLLEDL